MSKNRRKPGENSKPGAGSTDSAFKPVEPKEEWTLDTDLQIPYKAGLLKKPAPPVQLRLIILGKPVRKSEDSG